MFVSNSITNDPRVTGEAKALASAGNSVTIYGTFRDGLKQVEEWNGISFIRVRERYPNTNKIVAALLACITCTVKKETFHDRYYKIRDKQIIKRYERIVSRNTYDVYHAHDLDRLEIAAHCAENAGKPFVYDSHEYFHMGYFTSNGKISNSEIKRYQFILDMQKEYIKKAALVITVSESIAKTLQSEYSLKKPPLVIYNCANLRGRFKSNLLREMYLQTSNEQKIILYQGGIQRGRGLERFVELARRITDVDFVIIGPEPSQVYADGIRKQAEGLINLHIIPPVPYADLWRITASADFGYVYIEPIHRSYEMAAPNKTFEYLAAGLPMFTIDSTGTQELISQMPKENLPLFVMPESIDEAAAYVKCIIEETDMSRYVDAAYHIAETVFNRDIENRKLICAYAELTR